MRSGRAKVDLGGVRRLLGWMERTGQPARIAVAQLRAASGQTAQGGDHDERSQH